jgi:hypothetical protein
VAPDWALVTLTTRTEAGGKITDKVALLLVAVPATLVITTL